MKKKLLVLTLSLSLTLGLGTCGQTPPATVDSETSAVTESASDTEAAEITEVVEATENETDEPVSEVVGIDYQNIHFDYTDEISSFNAKSTAFTVPAAADIALTVADQNGATGVQLEQSADESNTTDYYLNALVSDNELTFSGDIKTATSQIGEDAPTDLTVADGAVKHTPATINADSPVDEVLTFTMSDDREYKVHTVNERIADINIYMEGETDNGVYSFAVDKFLIRVNTAGELIYYRNINTLGELMGENFMPQDTADGRFYTYFVELQQELRNANGGFSSGMYVVMDENYQEIDYITLMPNEDKNHTHGEGYLDQHEFVMLSRNHWISLSYTPLLVENVPDGKGIDGGNTAYVHAGIIQEVKDGEIIQEINSVDYELFYTSALECNDYETSTDQATADDIKDYVHVNSVAIDPKDDNYVVSMRHQYAVYKFDRNTGELLWILGGTDNQFDGLDDVIDADGNLFIGQHYAKYVDAAVAGNDSTLTVFDNHTSFQENLTRTMEFTLDETAMTATATVIQGSDLDPVTQKAHWATHCASVEHQSDSSVVIGWGLNAILDNNPETIGQHPILSDYNPNTESITFELSAMRNALTESHEACFSYRVYKTVD